MTQIIYPPEFQVGTSCHSVSTEPEHQDAVVAAHAELADQQRRLADAYDAWLADKEMIIALLIGRLKENG
ncbi:MAG: hypothetical protein DWQ53_09725 [Microcystis flos-aquae DF17]|nr:MAG: hypothetical protein DWQ53_09725 [Microcystis flos-aquae DF17]